jgi:hypothetical protein
MYRRHLSNLTAVGYTELKCHHKKLNKTAMKDTELYRPHVAVLVMLYSFPTIVLPSLV